MKMFPAWSKQAPCGQTNLPGVNLSRVMTRVFRHSVCGIVSQILDHLVLRIEQRDARAEIRHHGIAVLVEVEMAGQIRAGDEIDVLAFEREALNPVVAAVRHHQYRVAPPRVSTIIPCGQSSWPASFPIPPKVRMYSPLLLY